jgi:pyrroline-5-carboxylate reductase
MIKEKSIAILGGGNIGAAIFKGLTEYGGMDPSLFSITRRRKKLLESFRNAGAETELSNREAAVKSDIIFLTVLPRQLENVMKEIAPVLSSDKILISVVTAYGITEIKAMGDNTAPVVLAMPNTAVAVGESMTCLSVENGDSKTLETVTDLMNLCGKVLEIPERLMSGATILAACGVAFFMRYIRAASQGGIQVGFHASEAQLIAAQTAKGASKLLLESGNHPETEIDKVTTPMGCTIAGLNEMEHNGMSSALIKGIVTSYNEISKVK